ncbi:hypothetical protein [Nocardia farcinica]|nr:hypothetical protein [Nocardia farcinica]
MRENTDKPHRCPACHCVMPWRYTPIRQGLWGDMKGVSAWLFHAPRWVWMAWKKLDILMPRRCRECGDVIAVPAWIARPLRIKEN